MTTSISPEQFRIFIAYDLADAEFVAELCQSLRAHGHIVSLPEDEVYHVRSGLQPKALKACQILLAVVSPNSIEAVEPGDDSTVNVQANYFKTALRRHVISVYLKELQDSSAWPIHLWAGEIVNFTDAARSPEGYARAFDTLDDSLKQYYQRPRPSNLRDPRIHLAPKQVDVAPAEPPPSYRYEPLPRDTPYLAPGTVGIEQIHGEFPLAKLDTWLRAAEKSIYIADIWTSIIGTMAESLSEAVNRGAEVNILLLNPSSIAAARRSIDMQLEDSAVSDNVQVSIREIREMHRQVRSEHDLEGDNRVWLKLYNSLPAYPIYVVDDRILIGFLAFGRRSFGLPWLEVTSGSLLGEMAMQEYDQRCAAAEEYSILTPQSVEITTRERQVLESLSVGHSQQQIAEQLTVEVSTIKKHLQSIYTKLGASDMPQKNKDLLAVKLAQDLGLI